MRLRFGSVEEYQGHFRRLVDAEQCAQTDQFKQEVNCLSGAERERLGRALLGMQGRFLKRGVGGYLVYRYWRDRELKTEISPGDIVLVSRGKPRGTEPQGTVVARGKHFLDVAFKSALPRDFLREVRIDLWTNTITFDRMRRALAQMASWCLKEVIVGIKEPCWADKREDMDIRVEGLNFSQREAVAGVLAIRDVFLIHGPPGTGKTTTVAAAIAECVRRGWKVLATAETNVAVDTLVEKLVERGVRVVRVGNPVRMLPSVVAVSLDRRVERHPTWQEVLALRQQIEQLRTQQEKYVKPVPAVRRGLSNQQIMEMAECTQSTRGISPAALKGMRDWLKIQKQIDQLREQALQIEREIVRAELSNAPCVLATNSAAGMEELDGIHFDIVFVDEGSCATEPSVLIPAVRGRRLVLAGDHRQLPPVVLGNPQMAFTIFERLMQLYPDFSHMLTVQYRAHPLIMEFSNQKFYGGRLVPAASVRHRVLRVGHCPSAPIHLRSVLGKEPLVWMRCEGREQQPRGSASYLNRQEAQVVAKVVRTLVECGIPANEVGVLSPYDAQAKLLARMLEDTGVEVRTVDGFQGREKEVIVISFVRSERIGFLEDERRLNVALTRAKAKLVVVSVPWLGRLHPLYRELCAFLERFALIEEV